MIIITTSRRPKPPTRILCKFLTNLIPNSIKFNRGRSSLKDLIIKANELNSNLIILIDSLKGNPSRIRFFKIDGIEGKFHPLEIYIQGTFLGYEKLKRKIVNKNSKIEIRAIQKDKKITLLGENLAQIFNTNFIISPLPLKKINYRNGIKHETPIKSSEKLIYIYLIKINSKINIIFCKKNLEMLGPRIIIKDFKLK
ncbi:MAG: hypothetical protein ACTSWR_00325 [Candidatus Helarchaeota archaeon]